MEKFSLQEARERLDLTQQELAIRLGLTREYISMLENGKREVSEKFIRKFKSVYEISNENLHNTKDATLGQLILERLNELEQKLSVQAVQLSDIQALLVKLAGK